MYVNGFWLGVLVTVVVELVISILCVIKSASDAEKRRIDRKYKEMEGDSVDGTDKD